MSMSGCLGAPINGMRCFFATICAPPPIAAAYTQVKQALVAYHPEDDRQAYYDVKDPVCDIIISGAEGWAAATHWGVGATDC